MFLEGCSARNIVIWTLPRWKLHTVSCGTAAIDWHELQLMVSCRKKLGSASMQVQDFQDFPDFQD